MYYFILEEIEKLEKKEKEPFGITTDYLFLKTRLKILDSVKKYWKEILFSSVVLVLLAYKLVFVNDFFSGQDALTYHLIVSRYLAEHNTLPRTVPYDLYYKGMNKPPLLYIFTYPFFKLFGAKESVAYIVPFVLLLAFLYLMFRWCREEKISCGIFVFFLLINFSLLELMTWYYQACCVVFFSALAFYFTSKYFKTKKSEHAYYSLIAGFLASMSKMTGAGIFATAFLLFLFDCVKKKKPIRIFLAIPFTFITAWFYIFNKISPPPLKIISEHQKLALEFHPFVLIYQPLLIVYIVIFFAVSVLIALNRLKITNFEKTAILFAPLTFYLINVSFDWRYLSILVPFAIIYCAKYFSKVKLLKRNDNAIFFASVLALFIVFSAKFYNPQLKNLYMYHSFKKFCWFYKHDEMKGNFIGDADFGIGWWCRTNFIRFYDCLCDPYFANYTFKFIVDSWFNFTARIVNPFNESALIENISSYCPLKLIYNDGENKVWEVVGSACSCGAMRNRTFAKRFCKGRFGI